MAIPPFRFKDVQGQHAIIAAMILLRSNLQLVPFTTTGQMMGKPNALKIGIPLGEIDEALIIANLVQLGLTLHYVGSLAGQQFVRTRMISLLSRGRSRAMLMLNANSPSECALLQWHGAGYVTTWIQQAFSAPGLHIKGMTLGILIAVAGEDHT